MRGFMSLIKFNNGNIGNVLSRSFRDIFESMFNQAFLSNSVVARVPAVKICETMDNYQIEIATPGLTK